MCLFDLGLHDSATLHQPISFFTALAGVLSLCSVGCTWPLLHLMAFFQVQLSLLTASFKRMRSFSQSQELNRDPAHWYQSSNIIQAGCPWVQQEGAGSKRLCVYWGQDIEDRKVHLSGANHICLKDYPFSKEQWLRHFNLTKGCGIFGLGLYITDKEWVKIWRTLRIYT